MPQRPHPDSGVRLREATDALRQSLAGLNLSLREDHTVSGCLPVPRLSVPATAHDMTTQADDINEKLWESGVRRADPWIIAMTVCTHLSPDGVLAVWSIVSAWKDLLRCAAAHAEGRSQTFGLPDCQASLEARLGDLHAIITAGQDAAETDSGNPFGPPIDHYSRADALRDGSLIEADPKLCREIGYPPVHIALTSNAWADCVAWTDADSHRTRHHQDETGRLRDVLFMGRSAYRQAYAEARRTGEDASATFTLVRVPRVGPTNLATHIVLRLHFGPGDDGIPVVTIGQPGDD